MNQINMFCRCQGKVFDKGMKLFMTSVLWDMFKRMMKDCMLYVSNLLNPMMIERLFFIPDLEMLRVIGIGIFYTPILFGKREPKSCRKIIDT